MLIIRAHTGGIMAAIITLIATRITKTIKKEKETIAPVEEA